MKIIGIIPARGGSKGVPNKNVLEIQNKPLVTYAIEVGLKCPHLDVLMVSTDDASIASISRAAGAEVPFLRPAHLATDASPTINTLMHVVNYYEREGSYFDAICLLQPTTPFRSIVDLNSALATFKNGTADSLMSVRKVPHTYNPHWTFEENGEGYLAIAT